jgi:drug/metabolite transporter (DMT)-like permease
MKLPMLPILFALGTAICWGLYGPTLAHSRSPEKLWSPFKPYVGIGLAYLLIAIAGGLLAMKIKGDSFDFFGAQHAALKWGFAAGTLGALGALSLTSAMISFNGPPKAELVMPIVFGGAVTLTAIVSIITTKSKPNPLMLVGMALVTVGIVLVAYFTPHGQPPKKQQAPSEAAVEGAEQDTEESSS